MSRASDRDGYAGIADLYDDVAPYRERPDIRGVLIPLEILWRLVHR